MAIWLLIAACARRHLVTSCVVIVAALRGDDQPLAASADGEQPILRCGLCAQFDRQLPLR